MITELLLFFYNYKNNKSYCFLAHICNSSLVSIPTCVVSYLTLGTTSLLMKYFEDKICINIYEINCLNFSAEIIGYSTQSVSGRKVIEERIRKAIALGIFFIFFIK